MKKRSSKSEITNGETVGSPHPSVVGRYHEKALRRNQPRLTDLIPRSLWAYLSILLLGIISVYGIHRGYSWAETAELAPAGLFDLLAPGSISAWFMSSLLLLIAAASVQLYLLRRHRMDDYRGNYRCWLWISIVAILLSIDAATGAHRMISMVIEPMEIDGVWSNASVWWVTALSLVCGYQMIRVLIETKYRPFICLTSAVGLTAIIAAAVITVGLWPQATLAAKALLIHSGLLAYVMATWFFARRIYLDAQVNVPAKGHEEVRRTTRRIQPINVDDTLSSEPVAISNNTQAEDEHEQDDQVATVAADEESEHLEVTEDEVEDKVEDELEDEVEDEVEEYESAEDYEEQNDEIADEAEYYETEYDEDDSDEYSYSEYEAEDAYEQDAYKQESFDESETEGSSEIISQFKDAGWDDEDVELLAQLEREQKELERIAAEQHKSDEKESASTNSVGEQETVSDVESDSESRPSVILGPDGKSISSTAPKETREAPEKEPNNSDSSVFKMPNSSFNHGGAMPPVPQNEEEEVLLAQYDWPRMSKNQRKKLRKRLSRMRRGQAA